MPVPARGLLDTHILILLPWLDPRELPAEAAISAVTLGELSAGVHLVASQNGGERARRLQILQNVESQFDPFPFDARAARTYGSIVAAVHGIGRSPRRRVADLMIAAVAASNDLPLFTTNPADFAGLEEFLTVQPVSRPPAAP